MGEGCWVVYDFDGPPYPIAFFKDEITALRCINGLGYGRAKFIPFGETWNNAFKDETSRPLVGKR